LSVCCEGVMTDGDHADIYKAIGDLGGEVKVVKAYACETRNIVHRMDERQCKQGKTLARLGGIIGSVALLGGVIGLGVWVAGLF